MDSSNSEGLLPTDQYFPLDISLATSSPTDKTLGTLNSPCLDIFPSLKLPFQSPICNQLPPGWIDYTHNPQLSTLGDYTMAGLQSPTVTAPNGVYPGQLYSSIPIHGTQLKKRCRRRPEDIDRMYKCGYNGCEKAYGTLNHLNSHITMHAHGSKRTPEEFKEIRKERKARMKKESRRKVQEERNNVPAFNDSHHDGALQVGFFPDTYSEQLPSISYQYGAQLSPDYQICPETSNSQQILQSLN